ncbi:MAG: hypothetical protein ACTSPK_13280 [Candidatus Heimdallarchaeota archaeon]
MQFRKRMLNIVLVFFVVSFLPLQLTQAATNVDTLYSYPEEVPVLDGDFETTIWSSTRKLDIKLYNHQNQDSILYLSIMAVYNVENGSISFGITIPDETIANDMFVIVFKTNTTAPLIYYEDFWRFGANHDMKIFYPDLNSTDDGISFDGGIGGLFDIAEGGINNVQGQGIHTGTQYLFEINTPLASGDTAGKDFSLVKKDVIDFFVMYKDGTDIYTQIKTTDAEYEFCTLKVGKKGLLGPEPWFIVASLISTLAVISIISRKKNKLSSNK